MPPKDKQQQVDIRKGAKTDPQGQSEESLQHGADVLPPLGVLREGTRAVPSVKYALGVAAIAAAVSIGVGFAGSPIVAVLGVVTTLVLMVILVIFSAFARSRPASIKLLSLTLAWASLVLMLVASCLILTCFFFQWPRPLDEINARITSIIDRTDTAPPTTVKLSGTIEQIEICPHPSGDVQVFILMSIVNYGQPMSVQQYSLQITHVSSKNIEVKVEPREIKDQTTLPKDRITLLARAGSKENPIIQPQAAIVLKTEVAVPRNEKVSGWMWVRVPLLSPKDLSQSGIRYVVSFADVTGARHEVSYEVP